ncbi:hypothetical protein [Acidisphaera sp. S103]|uniref:hypothetical protein n=1 Tax=Acidisphaera sp. S103 TaxID=1747223 RepID=UPI00131A9DED|nr:hypothetical protein [Acidisphaera sp. S103]
MNKPNFWTDYADALELSVEGNRLIAQEIVGLGRGLWHSVVRLLDGVVRNLGQHQHLPPI